MRSGPKDVVEEDARVRVLVVDPDRRVLSALRELIDNEADLAVLAAVPRTEAVPTDLPAAGVALVDVSPPSEQGLLLVRRLSRTAGWRVVAMSIRSSSRRSAGDAGAFAFVDKGDDVEALLGVVRRAATDR